MLDHLTGKINREIEIKGPEPEASSLVGNLLSNYRRVWDSIEITTDNLVQIMRLAGR